MKFDVQIFLKAYWFAAHDHPVTTKERVDNKFTTDTMKLSLGIRFLVGISVRRSSAAISVAYGIIKSHRGDLKAFSGSGEGTRFIVKLPIYYENGV